MSLSRRPHWYNLHAQTHVYTNAVHASVCMRVCVYCTHIYVVPDLRVCEHLRNTMCVCVHSRNEWRIRQELGEKKGRADMRNNKSIEYLGKTFLECFWKRRKGTLPLTVGNPYPLCFWLPEHCITGFSGQWLRFTTAFLGSKWVEERTSRKNVRRIWRVLFSCSRPKTSSRKIEQILYQGSLVSFIFFSECWCHPGSSWTECWNFDSFWCKWTTFLGLNQSAVGRNLRSYQSKREPE